MRRLLCGGFFFLLAGCLGSSLTPPWGGERHRGGLLVDSTSGPLLTALEWGRSHGEQAEKLIDAYYRQPYLEGPVTQWAALHTKWTHLARYGAAQALAGKPVDPKVAESFATSPHLTIELTFQGYHRGLLAGADVLLVQRGKRIYPDRVRADLPRLTTDREKQTIYEGTLRVDFLYEKLNLRQEARVLIRRDEGPDLSFDFDLDRYK